MTLTEIIYRRPDGSYVGIVNGLPYHLLDDPALCPPELWQAALGIVAALGEPPLEPVPEPPPPSVPASITRRQCARELYLRQMITGTEMVAMTATGTPPAMVKVLIDAIENTSERMIARADFAAMSYERANPLLVGIMTATITAQTPGATEAQISAAIDDFFRAASAH
jgi:hypothetical protein